MYEISAEMDEKLREVMNEAKSVPGFLYSVFGFLSRHTDFYIDQQKGKPAVGFPPGFRQKIVYEAMNFYDPSAVCNIEDSDCVPFAMEEVEVVSGEYEEPKKEKLEKKKLEKKKLEKEELKLIQAELAKEDKFETTHESNSNWSPSFSADEYKNGSVNGNYCWSQTLSEVEITIALHPTAISAKHYSVKADANAITVKDTRNKRTLLEGKMWGKCKSQQLWWFIYNDKLSILVDKLQDVWWDKFLVSEKPIDPRSIEYFRDINELPEMTQHQIRKLRSEELAAGAMPSPSPDMKRQMELLRIAWDAEDSPFKGQPFDPSVVKFK